MKSQKHQKSKTFYKHAKIQNILKKQIELIEPSKQEEEKINLICNRIVKTLKENIKKQKLEAEVFVGGSLAKGTLVIKDIYDIDIFVRFDYGKNNDKKISELLGRLLKKTTSKNNTERINSMFKDEDTGVYSTVSPNPKQIPSFRMEYKSEGFGDIKKIHGSRDYYQSVKENILIEIIPVLKIKKPEQAMNVTDLSYFHVSYIMRKISKNRNLINEIRLAKNFAYAQNSYGAESYIKGFSGYALELLICHYKTFLNFIKAISDLDLKNKLVIDDDNLYKNKNILTEINKSKTTSPIILIDPTFKERNAVSSLSNETLYKFQKVCKNFLKNPSSKFFTRKQVSENFKNKDVKIITVKTSKQAGDVAGTKSKKFFNFLIFKLKKEFKIKKYNFDYDDNKNLAFLYLVLSKKKLSIVRGPPVTYIHNLTNFKKAHPKAFIKNGFAYVKLRHNLTFNQWFKQFLKKDKKVIMEMGVTGIKLVK